MNPSTDLRQVTFFRTLTDPQIAQLVERGEHLSLPAGVTLFRKGDAGSCMYALLEGRLQIALEDAEGHSVVLSNLENGDLVGEMALLDGQARSATAITLTACTLFQLERETFLDLLGDSQQLRSELLASLAARIRATSEGHLREEIARQKLQADIERERHRALAQMVAGVAHEVNTPLGIINTAASIINRELSSDVAGSLSADRKAKARFEDLLETADLIQRNAARAHTLVQAFKNLSVAQIVDTKEPLSLPDVITEILALFSIEARKAKLEVEFRNRLTEDEKRWVGYREHLSRILLNLLTNVQRYAYPGAGGKVEITAGIAPGHTPPYFIVTVRDWGAGIPPDNLPKVFEPFFTTGRGQGGSGLGLAMAYNLVTASLQGAIKAESSPSVDQGTLMTMTFPCTIPD